MTRTGASERCWSCGKPNPIWICTTCEARYYDEGGDGSKCRECHGRDAGISARAGNRAQPIRD